MALIPPFFSDAVVAIGVPGKGGPTWIASGFFYGQHLSTDPANVDARSYRIYLVTNKHVLKDKALIYIRVNPAAEGEAKGYEAPLIDISGNQLWTGHTVKSIDVAVLPINFDLFQQDQMQVNFFQSDQHTLDASGLRNAGASEGDAAFVLGFPMGLVGKKRSTVIVKGGVIARIRETFAKPTTAFHVDSAVFPGNSGGPVILRPEALAIEGTQAITKASLIGVVAAYLPYRDVAISQQTGRPRIIFEENSGLAVVYSADCIRQTIKRHEKRDAASQRDVTPTVSEEASNNSSAQVGLSD